MKARVRSAEALAAVEHLRLLGPYAITPDADGWPCIEGASARIEYDAGYAVITSDPRTARRLLGVQGARLDSRSNGTTRVRLRSDAIDPVLRILKPSRQ